MSTQVSQWRDTKGHRDGEFVRLVKRNGVSYRQFKKDDVVGRLIKFDDSDAESESESESESEDESAQDPSVPRNARRHAAALSSVSTQIQSASAPPGAPQHYALNSDPRGSLAQSAGERRQPELPASTHQTQDQSRERRHHVPPEQETSPRPLADETPTTNPSRSSSNQAAGFVSSLPRLCRDFGDIQKADYPALGNFMLRNREIVAEDYKLDFLREAVTARRVGLREFLESCVEKAVLINECLGLSTGGIRDYFNDLVHDGRQQRDFERAYQQALQTVSQRADRLPSAPVPSASASIVPTSARRHGYQSKDGTANLVPAGGHYEHRSSISDPTTLAFAINGLQIPGQSRQIMTQPALPRRNTTGGPPLLHPSPRTQDNTTHTGTSIGDQTANGGRLATLPSAQGVYDIKGTEGEEETLDSRYKVRRDARRFFTEGRVFAMLWHEEAGPNEKPDKDVKHVRRGRFGSRIFTHKRRMVVVRQREGYCCCLGINSYGGNGIGKKGLKPSEQQAHAIIHMDDAKPVKSVYEVGMTKLPIAVVMATGQELNSMSRLHYGQTNTVQWNVKVMDVGKVHKDSLPILIGSWRYELGFGDPI